MFQVHNADVAPDVFQERLALFECDPDGDIEVDEIGNNTYYLTEGYLYESGHAWPREVFPSPVSWLQG